VPDPGFNYNLTEDNYPNYQCHSEFSPTPLADTPGSERVDGGFPIPRTRGSSITHGPYLGSQCSITEQIHDFGFSDGARPGFPDSQVASQTHRAPFETPSCFYTAQATPIVSDKVAVVGHADPSLSPPAGVVGNRGTTHVPAELPPVGINNLGSSRRRKRSASPDCGHEAKHTRRKKRHLAARGQTQVSLTKIDLGQKGIVTTVVLDRPDRHAFAHAPRSLRGGTDRVQIPECAERLATFAFDRFHGPEGREKARRDQSRRRFEPVL